jgi:hypothetical protein
LRLAWCEHLGDEPARITAALRRTFASDDVVFSFGGIGATPDDHTRQCAAAALGVALRLHPEAEKEIRGRFGAETTPQRLKMGEFPAGADIIPNPFNRIPGFSVRDHHFVPGFPQMAWPMIEWLLDTKYRALADSQRWGEASVIVYGRRVHDHAADGGSERQVPGPEGVQPAQHGRGRGATAHRAGRAGCARRGRAGNGAPAAGRSGSRRQSGDTKPLISPV